MLYIQLIGLLAFCMLVLSFYRKDAKSILMFQSTANFAYAVHYFLLGAISGAYISLISILRNVLLSIAKKNKILIAIFIVILYLVVTFIFYENIYSVFPMTANTIFLIAILKDSKMSLLKGQLVGSVLWFTYGVSVSSYVEMVAQVILAISVIIQIKNMPKKENTEVKG